MALDVTAGVTSLEITGRGVAQVHRYAFGSEAEARAQFDRWVFVRILADGAHAEVASSAGWHVSPEAPLRDIREAIERNC